MTARPVPLPCGPTPDPARVTRDGVEVIVWPCYSGAYWVDPSHGSHEIGPHALAQRPVWLVCPGRGSTPAAHGDPARTALRPADAEAHSTEETDRV